MPLMPFLVTDMTDFAFIDSGAGGIPYMNSLLAKKSDAVCLYIADNKNFPYGEKSHEEVVACVVPLAKRICKAFEPRVIVVACNTISVNALEELRRQIPQVSFVGTVPAIKLAAGLSKKRRLGLLATRATVNNPYNDELMKNFAGDCTLVTRGDSELVDFIEKKSFTASPEECEEAVLPAVEFFRSKDCDTIILGCTHFLHLREVIQKVCGSGIKVVDSVDGVVRHALEVCYGGVTGVSPVQGGGRNEVRPRGETAPLLYVTGLLDETYKKQYERLCKKFNIEFKGAF